MEILNYYRKREREFLTFTFDNYTFLIECMQQTLIIIRIFTVLVLTLPTRFTN